MPASGLPERDAARPGPELAGVIRGRPSINPIRAQASTNRQNHRSSHKKSVTMFKAFGAVVQANPKPTARTAPVEQQPHSNSVMFSASSFGRACGAQERLSKGLILLNTIAQYTLFLRLYWESQCNTAEHGFT